MNRQLLTIQSNISAANEEIQRLEDNAENI